MAGYKNATLLAAVALAPLMTTQAFAQAESGGIETVTVTAQKRSENLVNVPISVVALSAQKLKDAGIKQMSDLQQVVPALHVDSSGAFFQPSIRGVGTAIAGA